MRDSLVMAEGARKFVKIYVYIVMKVLIAIKILREGSGVILS